MRDKKFLAVVEGQPIRFSELAGLLAKALHPADEGDDDLMGVNEYAQEAALERAVMHRQLKVRNPIHMGEHEFPHGAALQDAVVLPHDLRQYLEDRGIELRLIGTRPSVANEVPKPDYREPRPSLTTPLPKEEADTLRHCLSLLAPLHPPHERRTMAGNIEQRIKGEITALLSLRFTQLAALFYPGNQEKAQELAQRMQAAADAGELVTIIPPNEKGATFSDIAAWPECPPIPAESPLRYWLPHLKIAAPQNVSAGAPESEADTAQRPPLDTSARLPLNEFECVPYCTAAWQIGEQHGGWSHEQLHAFIDSLEVAMRRDVLRVRDKYGHEIVPSNVGHFHWHLCPADFNEWQREREHGRYEWKVREAQDLESQAKAVPVVVESADHAQAVEPNRAATAPVFSMTKAALIGAHKHEWPTIQQDIHGASTNGLAIAKAGARDWNEATALDWARARGKLKSAAKPEGLVQAVHSMASLPSRKHTL